MIIKIELDKTKYGCQFITGGHDGWEDHCPLKEQSAPDCNNCKLTEIWYDNWED